MRRHWPYVAITAVLSVAVAVWAIPQLGDDHGTTHLWVRGNDLLGVSLATHVDSLAAQVLLLAVGVGLLVQIYSTAYLGHHPRYRSYADLNGDGMIAGQAELMPLFLAAARDFAQPLFSYGPPRIARIGVELLF